MEDMGISPFKVNNGEPIDWHGYLSMDLYLMDCGFSITVTILLVVTLLEINIYF